MAFRISPLFAVPIIVSGIFAFLIVSNYTGSDELPSAREGESSPELILEPLGERTSFSADSLRADGVKLVNFWASWCAPCRVEHPYLVLLGEAGIPIYGINYKDDPLKAERFLDELGDPYRGIGADKGRTALEWGVYGIPETFIVDGNGTVVLRFAGPITSEALQNTILPAIQSAGGDVSSLLGASINNNAH